MPLYTLPVLDSPALAEPGRDIYIGADTDEIALTPTGDIAIIGGQLSTIQAIRQKLREFLGEWFLDESVGFPWFQLVFVKNPNIPAIREILRKQVLEIAGVNAINKLQLVVDAARRHLTVTLEVDGDEGQLTIVEEIP